MRKAWPILLAAVLCWASPSLAEDVPLGAVWILRDTCPSDMNEATLESLVAAAEKLTNITWSNPQWDQKYRDLCAVIPAGVCPERRRMLRWASRGARALLATEDCKRKRVFLYMESTPANPDELYNNLRTSPLFAADWLRELAATTSLTTTSIDWRSGQPGNMVGTQTAILPSRLPTPTESNSNTTSPSPAQSASPSPSPSPEKSPAPSSSPAKSPAPSPSPAKASPAPSSVPAPSPPLVRASTVAPSPPPGKGSSTPPSPSKSIGSSAPTLSPPPAAKSSPQPPPPPPSKPSSTLSPPAPYDYSNSPPSAPGEETDGSDGGAYYPPPPSSSQPPAPKGGAPSPPYLSPAASSPGTSEASAISPPSRPISAATQAPPPQNANVASTGGDSGSSGGGGGGGLSNGVIVAIVIGSVVALAVAAGTVAMCFVQNQRAAREKLNTELAAYRFKRATKSGSSMSHNSSNFDRWEMLKESHAVNAAELEQRTYSMRTRGGQELSSNTSWTERSREPAPVTSSSRGPAASPPSVSSAAREPASPPVTSYFARAPAPEVEHEIDLEERNVLSPGHSRSSHPETSPFSEKKSSNFFGRMSKKNLG